MFLMLAASGIDFDADLDELHELEAAEADLSEGVTWSNHPDYWERIKETLLKYSSAKETQHAIQEWVSDGRVFVKHGGTCELCGKVPITFHFPIANKVTKKQLIVGNECVRNYQQLAGRVNLTDLQKRIRKQKDLLRSGKATPEKLDSIEELYATEKALRVKLSAFLDEPDLDVLDYRNQLQSIEQVGNILRVQSTAFKMGRDVINACRAYLKFQEEIRKRQKYAAKGIADLISAIMRQKKGDYDGQISQLNQVGRLMNDILTAGKPNEVIARMWGAVAEARDSIVQQITVRGDETKAKTVSLYADDLRLAKPFPHLHFMLSAGITEHRSSISKKVDQIVKTLLSESFFDDIRAQRSLPVSANYQFHVELNAAEGSTARAAWNVHQFLDLVRKGFLRNVLAAIQERYSVTQVRDIAGVKVALLRAADDSLIDADADGAACVGKFVQLLQAGDPRILNLITTEVDDVKALASRKVHEQMSADLGIDVERVFKLYVVDNPTESSIISTIFTKTWPSGKKLSPNQMNHIQKQLAMYSRTKERSHSMWEHFKGKLLAPYSKAKF
jgi:hypothetical protein